MILIFILASLVSVEAIDDKKPSLMVVYQRDKDAINQGDEIRFDIFFPGDGNIQLCRCSFFYNGDLYDEIIYRSFDGPEKKMDVKVPAYTFLLNNSIFNNIPGASWYTTPAEIGANSEELNKVIAPLRIWLYTKSNISPGDHYLTLVLSYTDGNEWYVYEKNLEFHINNYFEQHPYALTIIGAIIGATAGVVLTKIWHKKKS